MNNVHVEYDGGIDVAKDDLLYEAASYVFGGEVKCDSGCGMSAPFTRDMTFMFPSASAAVIAAEKIMELHDVRVKVEIES